jgi:hypothetical protein
MRSRELGPTSIAPLHFSRSSVLSERSPRPSTAQASLSPSATYCETAVRWVILNATVRLFTTNLPLLDRTLQGPLKDLINTQMVAPRDPGVCVPRHDDWVPGVLRRAEWAEAIESLFAGGGITQAEVAEFLQV